MAQQQSVRFNVPAKGWNTDSPRRELGIEFSPELTNVFYENLNEAKRRPCQTPHIVAAPDGSAVDHIMEHKNINGTSKLFVHTANGNIYEDVAGTWTLRDSTFTGRIRSAMMGNLLVVGDGVNPAKKYNGTAWSAITTPPIAPFSSYIGNIFHVHKGRMYAAGDPARGMDIIVSSTIGGTGTGADYWSTVLAGGDQGDFIDTTADLPAGDTITGLTSHLGKLVVFYRSHIVFYDITEITGGISAAVHKVVHGEGCVSHDSIQGVGDDTIFLSPTGYKSLQQVLVQGDSGVRSASSPINNHVTTLLRTTVVEADIRSAYVPKLGAYICHLGSEQHCYQTQLGVWTKWTGLEKCLFTDAAGVAYTAGTTVQTLTDTVFADTIGAAAAVAATFSIDFASIRVSDQERKPRWNKAEIIGECDPDEVVTLSYYPSNDPTVAISESVTLNAGGGGRALVDLRVPIVGRSEMLGFRVVNANQTDFRLTALEAYFVLGGLR